MRTSTPSITDISSTEYAEEKADPCGDEQPARLTNSTYGKILSPNYPEYYPPNKDCSWIVEVDPEYSVRLSFNELSLEESSDCR